MLHHAQQLTHRPYTWHKRALHADQLSRLVHLMHGAAHVDAHPALVENLVQRFVGLGLNMLNPAVIKTQGSGPQKAPLFPNPRSACSPQDMHTHAAIHRPGCALCVKTPPRVNSEAPPLHLAVQFRIVGQQLRDDQLYRRIPGSQEAQCVQKAGSTGVLIVQHPPGGQALLQGAQQEVHSLLGGRVQQVPDARNRCGNGLQPAQLVHVMRHKGLAGADLVRLGMS